jgi:predicted CoA-binding protein
MTTTSYRPRTARYHNDVLDFLVNDEAGIRRILGAARTIAVVGLSSDPGRPSHDVASYLQAAGYGIIPVNPNETEVLGVPAVASLGQLERGAVDVVELFRRPGEVLTHVAEAAAIGARVFWMQDGVVNRAAAEAAHAAGMTVVMDRCMLRDHARWMR